MFQMEKLRQKQETWIQNIQWLSPETELMFPNSKFTRVFWSCLRRPSRHDQNSDEQRTAFKNRTMTAGIPSNWHEWNQKPIEANKFDWGYIMILTVKLQNASMQLFSRGEKRRRSFNMSFNSTKIKTNINGVMRWFQTDQDKANHKAAIQNNWGEAVSLEWGSGPQGYMSFLPLVLPPR